MSLPIFPPLINATLTAFACCLIFAGYTLLLVIWKQKNKKFWKLLTIVSASGVAIICLYFVFYFISSISGRSQVNAEWEKIAKAGLKTQAKDLLPNKMLPSSKNAANLYKAAFNILKSDDFSTKYYDIAVIKNKKYKVKKMSQLKKQAILDLANRTSVVNAVKLFSRGAAKEIAFNERNYKGFATILPNLNNNRSLIRAVCLKIRALALEGKNDEAFKLSAEVLKFVYQFRNEPLLIDHLVLIACLYLDIETLDYLLENHPVDTKNARKLIAHINKINLNQAVKKGINGEITICIKDGFEKLVKGEYDILMNLLAAKRTPFDDLIYLNPFLYQKYAKNLNGSLQIYKMFDQPYWQIKDKVKAFVPKRKNNLDDSFFSMAIVRTKTANMNSAINKTRITLALHIYKNQNGSFPEKLSDLVPAILPEIKADPLTGKPLNYEKTAKSFKLSGYYKFRKKL